MLDIENIKPEITRLCRRLKIKRLDIFGSATTDKFTQESDVDVLVEFDRTEGNLFDRYFELKERLEALLGRQVDVVTAKAIKNPYFKAKVEGSARSVYAS